MRVSKEELMSCCACDRLAVMLSEKDWVDFDDIISGARDIWWNKVGIQGWQQAFAAHPRIGDVDGLKKKFGAFANMSKNEQSSISGADDHVIQELAKWNSEYEEKFGHIFIICASGKSPSFMLSAIKKRYSNSPYKELSIAAIEQMKITELRLKQIFGKPNKEELQKIESRTGQLRGHLDGQPLVSPVTSHVLDTARGSPAEGVEILLEQKAPGSDDIWDPVASGTTNSDGRLPSFMTPSDRIDPGTYKVTFKTASYMESCKKKHPDFYADNAFYPSANVQFNVTTKSSTQHFHIPLTWNPYGYSTYRGS